MRINYLGLLKRIVGQQKDIVEIVAQQKEAIEILSELVIKHEKLIEELKKERV